MKYLIEITGRINKEIWYANRQGERFEAIPINRNETKYFMVKPGFYVHQEDCVIIYERQ